jgi:hypothetical protein
LVFLGVCRAILQDHLSDLAQKIGGSWLAWHPVTQASLDRADAV